MDFLKFGGGLAENRKWCHHKAAVLVNKEEDIFFICPTVDAKEEFNVSVSDERNEA